MPIYEFALVVSVMGANPAMPGLGQSLQTTRYTSFKSEAACYAELQKAMGEMRPGFVLTGLQPHPIGQFLKCEEVEVERKVPEIRRSK